MGYVQWKNGTMVSMETVVPWYQVFFRKSRWYHGLVVPWYHGFKNRPSGRRPILVPWFAIGSVDCWFWSYGSYHEREWQLVKRIQKFIRSDHGTNRGWFGLEPDHGTIFDKKKTTNFFRKKSYHILKTMGLFFVPLRSFFRNPEIIFRIPGTNF